MHLMNKQSMHGTRRMLLAVVFVMGMLVVAGVPAGAQEVVSGSSDAVELPAETDVLGESAERGTGAEVGSTEGNGSSGSLAFTGGDIATLAILGAGLVALGAIVLMRRRAHVAVHTT